MIYIKNSAPARCLYFPERICLTAQPVPLLTAQPYRAPPPVSMKRNHSSPWYTLPPGTDIPYAKHRPYTKKLHMHLYFLLFCCLWTNPDKIA